MIPLPYFYFYLPLIKEMGILLPFFPFDMDVLKVLNIMPS